jgi:hypothetical protein
MMRVKLTSVSSLAYHEIRLVLSNVLWSFDLALSEESEGWLEQDAYAVWEKRPLVVRLTPHEE